MIQLQMGTFLPELGQPLFELISWLDRGKEQQLVGVPLADDRHPGADAQPEVGLRSFGNPEIIGKAVEPG
jgi:hypothetical protein